MSNPILQTSRVAVVAGANKAQEWLKNPVDYLKFKTDITPQPSAPGLIQWNAVDGTYDMGILNGSIIQVGQETMFYGKAQGNINNGDPCQFAGVQGDHILMKKAVGSELDANPHLFLGVATNNIANNAYGYSTWIGKINGVYTKTPNNNDTVNWAENDTLYVNMATGYLTNTMPSVPNRIITVGSVIKTQTGSAENGVIIVRPYLGVKLQDLDDVNGTPLTADGQFPVWDNDGKYFDFTENINDYIPRTQNVITKDPTGFIAPANVIVNYDQNTRKITLTGNPTAYYQGRLITELVSGWLSEAHGTANGVWFLYYNGSAFVWSQTAWTFDMLQIAFVNYGATYKFAMKETHGMMNWQTHEELHQTIGTYLKSGGDLSGFTLASTTPANRRPIVSATVIADEDLPTSLPTLTSSLYNKMYLAGAGATTTFTGETAEIVPVLVNNPYYNRFDGANWIQTLMSNNSYMSVWLVAVPVCAGTVCQSYRYIWVQGQSNGTLASQQALLPADLNLGQLAGIAPEFVFIGKIIIRFQGGNWDFTSVQKLTGNKYNQTAVPTGSYLSTVNTDSSLTGSGTTLSPLSVLKTWTDYATRWTVAPTLYDTQPTYDVYEYTYGTTKYYRKVLLTYNPSEDKFFSDTALTILITSRALTI